MKQKSPKFLKLPINPALQFAQARIADLNYSIQKLEEQRATLARERNQWVACLPKQFRSNHPNNAVVKADKPVIDAYTGSHRKLVMDRKAGFEVVKLGPQRADPPEKVSKGAYLGSPSAWDNEAFVLDFLNRGLLSHIRYAHHHPTKRPYVKKNKAFWSKRGMRPTAWRDGKPTAWESGR